MKNLKILSKKVVEFEGTTYNLEVKSNFEYLQKRLPEAEFNVLIDKEILPEVKIVEPVKVENIEPVIVEKKTSKKKLIKGNNDAVEIIDKDTEPEQYKFNSETDF